MEIIFKPANDLQKKYIESSKRYIMLSGAVAAGKAQPLDSKICTPSGFKLMRDIKIGDIISSAIGGNTQVIAIHPQGEKEIFEITFGDKSKTRCTEEHLWDCWISENGRRKIRTTKEIIRMYNHTNQRVIIPVCEPVEFEYKLVPIDAYFLGLLLGDGGLQHGTIQLTNIDTEVINYSINYMKDYKIVRRGISYFFTHGLRNKKGVLYNPFTDLIRELNLNVRSEFKHVPELYLFNSIQIRKNILAGLMDTDGTVCKKGKVSFCSKSKQLALDVQFLVRSLGGRATLSEKIKFCWHKGEKKYGTYYDVYIRIKNAQEYFKIQRKKARIKPFNGGISEIGRRIIKIEKVGTEICQCITTSSLDGLYITDDFIVTHNSFLSCWKGFLLNIQYPGSRGLICRKEARSLQNSTIRTLFDKVIPQEMIVSYNRQDGVLIHRTLNPSIHSSIVFCGLDKKADQSYPTKIASTEYSWIFLEEGTEAENGDWEMLSTRIRYNVSQCPNMLFTATNPDAPNHFLYKFFFESKEPNREVISTTPYDNPYLPKDYLASLELSLTGIARERLLYGKWVQAEGVIYKSFDFTKHICDNSVFLPIKDYKAVYFGADSNFPLPRAAVIAGIRGDGTVDILDEFYQENAHVEDLIAWLIEWQKKREWTIYGFHDPSDPLAIDKLNRTQGIVCEKADNAVIPGISEVSRYFDNNLIRINKNCINLIRCLQSYRWKVEGEAPDKTGESSHINDGLRYLLQSIRTIPSLKVIGARIFK